MSGLLYGLRCLMILAAEAAFYAVARLGMKLGLYGWADWLLARWRG